jgi:hypothetical protein
LDNPMRHPTQADQAAKVHNWWTGLVCGAVTVAAVWLLTIKMTSPANILVAFLLMAGFWSAGSITKLRERWPIFARELRLTAAGFVGLACVVLIKEVF